MMPVIKIDESLFGHINTDAFLKGSYRLQGHQFHRTIGYLNAYLERETAVPEDVRKMQHASESLVRYDGYVEALRTNGTALAAFSEKIYEDILALTGDHYLLMPGGWLGQNGGHAMVYQFHMDSDGNLLFSINNSGSGLTFHEKRSHKDKELYNPVLTYKIPKEQLRNKVYICAIIGKLLEAQVPSLHRREKIEASYLYESVFTQWSYVGGNIVASSDSDPTYWYTAGQLSGTCAQRSLHQMLKSRFENLDSYRRFIYGFKAHALDDYITSLKTNGLWLRKEYHSQIEKAIRHQLRLLSVKKEDDPSTDLFTEIEKERDLAKLTAYLAELNAIKRTEVSEAAALKAKPISNTHTIRLPTIKSVTAGSFRDFSPVDVTPPETITGGATLLPQLDRVLERCRQLTAREQNAALLEQLEELFLNFPLPEHKVDDPLLDFYAGIDSEEKAFEFYKKINQLQKYYFECCNRLVGAQITLPRMYLVKTSIFTVLGHVNSRFCLTVNNSCYHPQTHGIMQGLVQAQDAVYLAMNDPTIDARYTHILRLYKKPASNLSSDKEHLYYQALLDNYPALKETLETRYVEKYGAIRAPFHEALRSNRATGLYYFLMHRQELRAEMAFKPLIDKFNVQEEMERAYAYYGSRMLGGKSAAHKEQSIQLEHSYDLKLRVTSPFSSNETSYSVSPTLTQTKYGLSSNGTAYAFMRDIPESVYARGSKRTDNHTQLLPAIWAFKDDPRSSLSGLTQEQLRELSSRSITSSDVEERELFHLRRYAPFQIPLTLDYFNRHLEKLNRHAMQVYVEGNLFQPGCLLEQLDEEHREAFLSQFDTFIENGLAFFEKKGKLSLDSVFFIRLAFLVNLYALKLDNRCFSERFEKFYQKLNVLIAITEDHRIQYSLHQYRFLMTLASCKLHPEIIADKLKEILPSYFKIQAFANDAESLDTDTRFQLQCAKHELKRLLRQPGLELPQELLLTIVEQLGVTLKKERCTVTGAYPLFEITTDTGEHYVLNIEEGLAFKNNLAFGPTPMDIIHHPLVKQLGLTLPHNCLIYPNGKTFLIDHPPLEIRFIKDALGKYQIQKKWTNSEGLTRWYQLAALSKAQGDFLQLSAENELPSSFPAIMKERNMLAWVCCEEPEVLLTNSQHHICYRGKKVSDSAWQFEDGEHGRLCQRDSWLHTAFGNFEEKEFITVSEKDEAHIINLPRYGLTFAVPRGEDKPHFTWQGSDYQFKEPQLSLGKGIAQVFFNNAKQDLCILPITQFVNAGHRASAHEYYSLQQDTQTLIPHTIVEKLLKKDPLPRAWQYSGQEQFMVMTVADGKPIPQSPAEALYLAYIYLGSHQPEKAWAVLDDCSKRLGGLVGTYEELRYLNWILNALPRQLEDTDGEAVVSNPPFVACKLKALALLTQCPTPYKDIVFPEPVSDPSTVNGIYERHTLQEEKSFFSGLNGSIYHLYSRMQVMQREMPVEFTLSYEERRSLLNFYHDQLPQPTHGSKALGALGYEWVELNLITLRQELANLMVKSSASVLTPYEARRKVEIETFIREHQGIAKKQSNLVYVAIDLHLPEKIQVNTTTLSYNSKEIINNYKAFTSLAHTPAEQAVAIAALRPNVSDDEFIQYFSRYLLIANEVSNPFRPQLEQYCKATLIAYRHTPLDKQPTNLPLLCNVLLRVLASGKALPVTPSYAKVESYYELIRYAQALPQPPRITVPELQDDTSELLSKVHDVFDRIPVKTHPITPVLSTEVKHQVKSLSIGLEGIIGTLRSDWQALDLTFRTGLASDAASTVATEEEAGENKYKALKALQSFAKEHFGASTNRGRLAAIVEDKLIAFNGLQEVLLAELIEYANQGPEDREEKRQWQIDILSNKRRALDINRLLTLYFHADKARYQIETGLSEEKINKLHGLLTQFVAQGLISQQLQRIKVQLAEVESARDIPSSEQALFKLAQALFTENLVDVIENPVLSLFQYHENILLHPQQHAAISRLLSISSDNPEKYSEVIEKIIMGGGKSKVLLPTLAQQKATGSNLVIIEVPRALLRTNYVDLKATSEKLFNQTAYLLEFDRESDCSVEQLKKLYADLSDVMIHKKYVVTTGDALQSLELKYLELLSSRPEPKGGSADDDEALNNWQQQVMWADRLVLLLRNRGDLIIDEVHEGLLLKNKLNYTLDESGHVSKPLLANCVKLYQFFDKVSLAGITGLEDTSTLTLLDVVKNNKLFTDDAQFEEVCELLVEQLVSHAESPLNFFVKTLNLPEQRSQLKAYLQDKGDGIPAFVLSARPGVKEQLALYKEQVSHLLAYTLRRNQGEHYGPSQIATHASSIRALAIPYFCNDKPNERSRFASFLETINFTIQSLLITGVPKDLLRTFFENLQISAYKECYELGVESIDETPSAALFKALLNGAFELSQLDLENEALFNALHQQLYKQEGLIFEILQSDVLKHIKKDTTILHSDAYSHVDIVRSCQGMTGTPWNHSTYHQRLSFDTRTALGTDGYIIQGIKAKNPAIIALDFKDVSSCIADLFNHYRSREDVQLRTIIDSCAMFNGVDNLTVARTIADYVKHHPTMFNRPEPLRYVLFFNELGQLSALRIEGDIEHQIPIMLGTSDPTLINERLGCNPGARFTFYDQSHTVGVDIKQCEQAHGLVMVDRNTHSSIFKQSAMRMRGLIEGNQHIDIVVPKSLEHKNLNELYDLMETREQEQLQHDNFNAARLRMTNIIRADLMHRILDIHGEGAELKKHQLLALFKAYFIEDQEVDFFTQYGRLSTVRPTKDLLIEHQNRLVADWQRLVAMTNQTNADDEQRLISLLDNIVAQACKPGMCATHQVSRSVPEGVEVTVENEVQVEVFVEQQIEQETFDPLREEERYVSLGYTFSLRYFSLKDICRSSGSTFVPDFSENIIATQNFYQAYKGQTNFLGMHLKPVHALLFKKEGGRLLCTILTQRECEELQSKIKAENRPDVWITTTQHTVLAGRPLANHKMDLEYRTIIEQIRYFNGEFDLLLEEDASLDWLGENSREKLLFFEKYLYPCRETLPVYVNQLHTALNANQLVYKFIANTPTVDRTDFDWKEQFPDIDEGDIESFRRVSKAFNNVASEWWEGDLTRIMAREKGGIPLRGLGYLSLYVAKLQLLKFGIKAIEANPGKPVTSLINAQQASEICRKFPALASLLQSASHPEPQKQNYLILSFMLKEIPITSAFARTILLREIAKNPHILEEDVVECCKIAAHDKKMLINLLSNTSTQITQGIFDELCSMEQDETTLSLVAAHPHLQEKDYQSLLARASNANATLILTGLLSHLPISLPMLKALANIAYLNEDHIDQFTSQELDKDLLTLLLKKAASDAVLRKLIQSKVFSEVEVDTLLEVLQKSNDTIVMQAVLAQQDKINEDILATIAGKETADAELLAIVAAKTSSDETRLLIANHKKATSEILTNVISGTSDVRIFDTVLSQKTKINENILALIAGKESATETQLTTVAERTRSEDVRLVIANHTNSTAAVLAIIVEASADIRVFKAALRQQEKINEVILGYIVSKAVTTAELLAQVAIKTQLDGTRLLIVKHSNATSDVLFKVLENTDDVSVFEAVLAQSDKVNEEIFSLIAKKKSASSQLLADIAQKTQLDAVRLSIAQHAKVTSAILATTVEKAADARVFEAALAQNSKIDEKILTLIAGKESVTSELLNEVAQRTRLDKVRLLIAFHPHVSTNTLIKIISDTEDARIFAAALTQSDKVNEDILTLIAGKESTTAASLTDIARKTQLDSVRLLIANHPNVTSEILEKVVGDAEDIRVFAAALAQNTKVNENLLTLIAGKRNTPSTLLAAIALRTTLDDVLLLIANHPNVTSDELKTLVDMTSDPRVFSAALAQKDKINESILFSIAVKESATAEVLLEVATRTRMVEVYLLIASHAHASSDVLAKVIEDSDDIRVFNAALAQSDKINENILTLIARKKCTTSALLTHIADKTHSDDVRLLVAQHPNVTSDILAKVVEATDDVRIFQAALEQEDKINEDILSSIARKPTTTSAVLKTIAERTSLDDVRLSIARHAQVTSAILLKVIADTDNVAIFNAALAQTAQANEDILVLIAGKNTASLECLKRLNASEKITEASRFIIASHIESDDDFLSQIVLDSKDARVLGAALANAKASEKTFNAISTHEASSTELLVLTAQKTSEPAVITECFSRVQDEPLALIQSIADNPKVSGEVLNAILDKITDFENYIEYINGILQNLESRNEPINPQFVTKFYTYYIQLLLKEIAKEKFCPSDREEHQAYANEITEKLDGITTIAHGKELMKNVNSVLEGLRSPTMQRIKGEVERLHRRSSYFWTVSMGEKAKRIENAMISVPLKERALIFAAKEVRSESVNKVREALAMQRHIGKRGVVYKDKNNEIIEEKAAETFKKAKGPGLSN